MAPPMNPRASIPQATEVASTPRSLDFTREAFSAERLRARAPQARKPLRPRKERLPVATEVDPVQLRNRGDRPEARQVAPPPPAGPPLAPPPASPAPVITFDGGVDDDTSIPPDTAGAVSPAHVFNPLNNRVHVFDRTGASLADLALDDFWSLPPQDSAFDPRAVFEPRRGRFVFVSMVNAARPDSALLVAVSETDDPTGNWLTHRVPVDPARQGNVWLDYPCVGFSADKVTVQVNLFTLSGLEESPFAGSSIYVWDQDQLFNDPQTARASLFTLTDQGGTQMPVSTHDPGQSAQLLVSRWSGNVEGSGFYALYEITGRVQDGTIALARLGFVQTPGVTWDSFSPSGDIAPQRDTARRIDAGDDRILSAVLRDGSIWLAHTAYLPAGGPNRTAAQWLQFDLTPQRVLQLGRMDDPMGRELFAFPSLAVNAAGAAILGMARFAADQFAGAAYAVRKSTDAPGQMRALRIYAPGLNSYFKTFSDTKNRWGDYSATQVDPANDLDFWTVQELASSRSNFWATKWAHVRV